MNIANVLQTLNIMAATFGLKLSLTKTTLQNKGAGDLPCTFSLDRVSVEGVEEFTYLSSRQSVTGCCCPDMEKIIGLAISMIRYNTIEEQWTVVVSRLIYAASAWIGFTTRTDIQHIDAFLRRCKRGGYCSPDLSDLVQLVEEGDDRLFRKIINNSSHVLHGLLPQSSSQNSEAAIQPAASSTW